MSQAPNETKRTQFLLTNLVILAIIILALALLIALYPTLLAPSPRPTFTPLPSLPGTLIPSPTPSITPSPTQSRTLRPTLTPSITPTPTETLPPTLTPSPTGPPSLSQARPVAADPYTLQPWSAEQAETMIQYMNSYPNTLSKQSRGEDDAGYYQAYQYAAVAQKEGLLRYPSAPQAERWAWELAHNLAQSGQPDAGQQYANLIARGLNSGEVSVAGLPDWFREREPRGRLYMVELKPPAGYSSSRLLEVYGNGGAYLWLLETPSAYQAIPLTTHFDFANKPDTASIVSDFDGDGQEEAALYFTKSPDKFNLAPPRVFNLSKFPARELTFRPSDGFYVGMDFDQYWGVTQDQEGQNLLYFQSDIFPACAVQVYRSYRWNGSAFELVETKYTPKPNPATLSYCRFMADHAIQNWGPQAAIQIMEPILPDWPPEKMEDGSPFPIEGGDEWRYRLGVYHALVGNFDQAVGYLNQVVNEPGAPDSLWIDPARQFLAHYKKPEDVYRACVEVEDCDPRLAIEYLANTALPQSSLDAVQFLWQTGVAPIASGYFDFDADGQRERWLTVRHRPLEKLELWILAETQGGTQAMRVGNIESSKPDLSYVNEADTHPHVQVEPGLTLRLMRDAESSTPYLVFGDPEIQINNPFRDGLQAAIEDLFSGSDPAAVQDALLKLQEYPGLMCEATWSCDEYYYILGLASELAGDGRGAIDAYLYLWWNYSKSPYTIMARLKLKPTITPPAVVRTLTPTPSPIATPGQGTPTPTALPSLTLTPAGPYPSPSATTTNTPYPTP